ncbi:MAG: hypothetical protein AAFS04_03475 [Cyanobacteria bacterium J06631_9]
MKKITLTGLRKGVRRGFSLFALLGVAAVSVPTAAIAQYTSQDQQYLTDLYNFLQSQDELTYALAADEMGHEGNIWVAQSFCSEFENGVSPEDVYSIFTSAALSQLQAPSAQAYEEIAYSIGLYGGSVMNLGSAYYCPQYQPQVEQALRSL